MKEKFDELVKKANEAFRDDERYNDFWEDGDLMEDGKTAFPGIQVHEEADGAGEKYQSYQEVYRYIFDGKEIYLSLTYTGTGSYYSDFYYDGFELEEVERTVRTIEIVEYR